jgi:subtilisin family serine protease
MAAGTNTADQTDSHAPGTGLIVGKVLSESGAAWEDVNRGIHWAIDRGADVITLSVYSYFPEPLVPVAFGYPDGEQQLFDAIEAAVDHGAYVTVLAGNGLGNVCVPTVSWLHPPAASPGATVVGGADSQGLPATCSSRAPEVTAPYSADVADNECDDCYRDGSGTSYSTPLVAGIGARVIDAARQLGIEPTPPLVEGAIEFAAEDTPAPPTLEGYGYLGDDAAERAIAELPEPGPDTTAERVNQAYVEDVQDNQRDTWYAANR